MEPDMCQGSGLQVNADLMNIVALFHSLPFPLSHTLPVQNDGLVSCFPDILQSISTPSCRIVIPCREVLEIAADSDTVHTMPSQHGQAVGWCSGGTALPPGVQCSCRFKSEGARHPGHAASGNKAHLQGEPPPV